MSTDENERDEAPRREQADGLIPEPEPLPTERLNRAVTRLQRYDVLISEVNDEREKADLQRWRIKAAAEVLRSAVMAVDGKIPEKIARPLSDVEAACDNAAPLPRWLDPESFVGTALVVGIAVLATTVAAPIGAVLVGDSIVKETVKAAVTSMVASVLTQASNRHLEAMHDRHLRSVGEVPFKSAAPYPSSIPTPSEVVTDFTYPDQEERQNDAPPYVPPSEPESRLDDVVTTSEIPFDSWTRSSTSGTLQEPGDPPDSLGNAPSKI